MESQSHSELLAKISILEMKLADAEQRAATADQLAKDIAISADEHVQELERMLEFKITEEQYQQQAINYVKRIDILESELKEQRHETRKAIQDNYELALSAKKHVDEIVGQLLDSERKNERLQILLDSEKKNKSANDRIHQSQPQQSETASLPTESEKARQSIVRVRKGSIFKRQSISIETSSPLALVVIKQGYLQKKSPSFLIGWQSRYFVLRGDLVMLYYAKEQEFRYDEEAKGSINLGLVPTARINDLIFCTDEILKMNIQGRLYELSCGKKEIAVEWVTAIRNACLSKQ